MWVFFFFFCIVGARDDMSIFDFFHRKQKKMLLINTQNIIEKWTMSHDDGCATNKKNIEISLIQLKEKKKIQ